MQLASTSFTSSEPVAVVGNGPDALTAVRLLRAAGANVRWYSHDIDVAEEALLASSPPGWLELSFADPLNGFGDAVVVVSADDGPLDDAVAARARAANIPVHIVDRPEISTVQLFTGEKRRSTWPTGPIGRDWKGFRARRTDSEQRVAS